MGNGASQVILKCRQGGDPCWSRPWGLADATPGEGQDGTQPWKQSSREETLAGILRWAWLGGLLHPLATVLPGSRGNQGETPPLLPQQRPYLKDKPETLRRGAKGHTWAPKEPAIPCSPGCSSCRVRPLTPDPAWLTPLGKPHRNLS